MPGSGKTTIGGALSAISGRKCVDIDDIIVQKAGMTIPKIFAKYGEDHFRLLETEAVSEVSKLSGIIITAGGGVVTQPRNYPLLHQNGRIYEICRPLELLATDGRPLSTGLDALAAMYEKRRPLYESFRDVKVDNNSTVENCAQKIWSDFCENSCY
jgi:shikimate dehydrogenase